MRLKFKATIEVEYEFDVDETSGAYPDCGTIEEIAVAERENLETGDYLFSTMSTPGTRCETTAITGELVHADGTTTSTTL